MSIHQNAGSRLEFIPASRHPAKSSSGRARLAFGRDPYFALRAGLVTDHLGDRRVATPRFTSCPVALPKLGSSGLARTIGTEPSVPDKFSLSRFVGRALPPQKFFIPLSRKEIV